ncbi:unnamed protein product [Rotaria socialis]|uniref:Uncharacterized protein n=1 Tax=Rotaria socialis TaxID=392032 RepID=A0A818PR32_9BILA|nr:unnamed protein product [Rotaria socialis]
MPIKFKFKFRSTYLYVQVIDNIFDEYTLQIREAYGIDQGLGSILGKAKVQISRLAAAIHATSLASAVFDQLANDDSLPDTMKKANQSWTLRMVVLGVLAKEKSNGAHKATTFFIKTTIDPKRDAAQLAAFTIQLARYNISLKSYKESLQLERSSVVNEAQYGENVDELLTNQDISMSSPPRSPSSNGSTLPMSTETSPTKHIVSSNTILGFNQEGKQFTTPTQRRKNQNTPIPNVSTSDQFNAKVIQHTKTSNTKNRIEPLQKPTSPLTSPQRNVYQSQEYAYKYM